MTAIIDIYTNEPLNVIHGTNTIFDRFDNSFAGQNTDNNADDEWWAQTAHMGFWFNIGGHLQSAYKHAMICRLDIERPYQVGCVDYLALEIQAEGSAEALRDRLIDEGYDGIMVDWDEEYGGTSYVAFDADQITLIDRAELK